MNQSAPRFFRGVSAIGAAFAASIAFHVAPAGAEEPVAVFAGDGLECVIDDAGSGGRELRGRLHHLGQWYPFTATTRDDFGRSDGTFRVGTDAFAFSLLPTGDAATLRLVTRNVRQQSEVTYDLRRRDTAPTPVASPAVSPVPATPAAPAPVGLTLRGPFSGGWEVTAVDLGSRAELAGFSSGDVITAARKADGADVPLSDRADVIAALTTPGIYLTVARTDRADHTVVLYPLSPPVPSLSVAERPAIAPPDAGPAEVEAGSASTTARARAEAEQASDTRPAPASELASAAAVQPTPVPAGSAPAPTAVFTLQPAAVGDTVVTGFPSHTLLLPEGWSLDAEVHWTPAVDAAFVNVNARATSSGGGHQVTWLPDGAFTGAVDAGTAFGAIADGKVHFPRCVSPAAFVRDAVLPGFRPAATGVQVLSDDGLPGLADAWKQHHETFLTTQKKHASALHGRRAGGLSSSTTAEVTAPRVRLRYEESGVGYDEEFTFIQLVLTTPAGEAPAHDWFVFAVSALRAPAGKLDAATPGLRTVAESLRPTQRWQAVIEALTPELTRAQPPLTSAQAVDLAGPLLRDLDSLVTAHTRGWTALRAADVARIEAVAASGSGLGVTQTADGTVRRLLPLGGGLRALTNTRGVVVLTADPPASDAARPDGPWESLK